MKILKKAEAEMIPKTYDLNCGGTLSVCSTEKFKAGMLSVSFVLPIERETVWKTSLLLSVLRRGTQKYPTLAAINQRLDFLYGTELSIRNFYRGDCQIIGFSADLLSSAYLPCGEDLVAKVLDVMREIFWNPVLDENQVLCAKYVESEKKQQCDAIRAQKNNPRAYASEQCRALLYADEPCGASVLGRIEDIEAITAAELTAHWRQILCSVTPACFFVGAEDPIRVKQAIEDAFDNQFEKHRTPMTHVDLHTVRRKEAAIRREEELPVGQSQLVIGLGTGASLADPDYCACALYNELLGASPVSKLFMNVRERLSLCYFCSSHYNAYKGTVTVHCGLDRDDIALAEAEIYAQLQALSAGEFTDAELAAAKRSIINAYRQLADSPTAVESFYFGRRLAGADDTPERLCARLETVSREDVSKVAKQIAVNVVYVLNGTLASGEEDGDGNEND